MSIRIRRLRGMLTCATRCWGMPIEPFRTVVRRHMYLAGSVFKLLRRKQQHQRKRSPASPAPAAVGVAATGSTTPSLLAVASPNKTWVGVAGAIILGTTTALALEGLTCRLFAGTLSRASDGLSDVFSITALNQGLLCATGVALCMVGVVGDLWESLLKRAAMVKVSVFHWLCCKRGTVCRVG